MAAPTRVITRMADAIQATGTASHDPRGPRVRWSRERHGPQVLLDSKRKGDRSTRPTFEFAEIPVRASGRRGRLLVPAGRLWAAWIAAPTRVITRMDAAIQASMSSESRPTRAAGSLVTRAARVTRVASTGSERREVDRPRFDFAEIPVRTADVWDICWYPRIPSRDPSLAWRGLILATVAVGIYGTCASLVRTRWRSILTIGSAFGSSSSHAGRIVKRGAE